VSDTNYLTQIRSIALSESTDLMNITSGTHSTELENGVVLTVTIENGKMTKHEARDNQGTLLKTSLLRLHSEDEGTICFVCWQLDGDYGRGYCRRMPCRLM
jgi:hypothetical protein